MLTASLLPNGDLGLQLLELWRTLGPWVEHWKQRQSISKDC